jgi:hypothetical protein
VEVGVCRLIDHLSFSYLAASVMIECYSEHFTDASDLFYISCCLNPNFLFGATIIDFPI